MNFVRTSLLSMAFAGGAFAQLPGPQATPQRSEVSSLDAVRKSYEAIQRAIEQDSIRKHIRTALNDRKLTFREFGEAKKNQTGRPTNFKARVMTNVERNEAPEGAIVLVNDNPIYRDEWDAALAYARSYPRKRAPLDVQREVMNQLLENRMIGANFSFALEGLMSAVTDIHAQVTQPDADFGDIASKKSQAQDSAEFGSMGWIGRNDYDPMLTMRAFQMQPGEISEPFQTKFGMEIIKLHELREAEDAADDQARVSHIVRAFAMGSEDELDSMLMQLRRGRARVLVIDSEFLRVLPEIYR